MGTGVIGAGTTTGPQAGAGGLRIRWIVLAILTSSAFMAYVQRTGIGVAAERMMPELGLTQSDIGWLQSAFLVSYTAFQVPGGVAGEIWGARIVLTLIGLLAVAATAGTALLPAVLGGSALMLGLLVLRFIFGVSQGPIFPVVSGVIESWFPAGRWGTPQGLLTAGMNLGGAATPPLVAWLMVAFGWQVALLVTGLPALITAGLWWSYGRNRPEEHASVGTAELAELAEAGAHAPPTASRKVTLRDMIRLLLGREVLLISLSYFLMNYAFYLLGSWCFLYLVEDRHFAILDGGLVASLPWVAAGIGSAIGGPICDRACQRLGLAWGFRLVPLIGLPTGAAALMWAVDTDTPGIAVIALSLAYGAIEMTEGPYWASTTQVAQEDTMAATGVLNTMANLGGLVSTPIIASLSGAGHWDTAFVTGAVCLLAAALLWLGVDGGRRANIH